MRQLATIPAKPLHHGSMLKPAGYFFFARWYHHNKTQWRNVLAAPSKYDPKYCDELIAFFDRKPFDFAKTTDENGEEVIAVNKNGAPVITPCAFPTFERFAYSIGVHRETLRNWCNANDEFFAAYKKAEMLQKDILIQNGLMGGYEKTFAIFTAKNVTDMCDKHEIDHKLVKDDGSNEW